MRSHSSSSFSVFSTASAPAPAPLVRSSSVRYDGEREDGGSGAREEGDGEGEGEKSSRGGSSSRSGLPRGWIQGDWIRSTIIQDDLDDLLEGGLIPHESARLPGNETEPRPLEGECSSTFLSWFLELLRGSTPPLFSKHHRVPRCFRVYV